jgi:hypothetical protein
LLGIESKDLGKVLSDEVCLDLLYKRFLVIYNCLQQPVILEPEAELEENRAASLFDNDNDIQIEEVQELGDVDNDRDIDMIPTELPSRHSSMSNHPPVTDSDRDIVMLDNEDSEPDAAEADHQSNHRQQSPKLDSSTQSVGDNVSVSTF